MTSDVEFFILEDERTNFSWAIVGPLLIQFSLSGTVPTLRYDLYLDSLRSRKVTHLLSVTRGSSSITSVQRKTAADIAKTKDLKIAAVLDSALTRGLMTAFGWLGVQIKGFRPETMDDAIAYLDTPGVRGDKIKEILARLEEVTFPTGE